MDVNLLVGELRPESRRRLGRINEDADVLVAMRPYSIGGGCRRRELSVVEGLAKLA